VAKLSILSQLLPYGEQLGGGWRFPLSILSQSLLDPHLDYFRVHSGRLSILSQLLRQSLMP
jgi:hypothetical protein